MKVGDLSVGGIIGIIIAVVTLGIIAGLGFIIVILKINLQGRNLGV